MTTNQVGDRGAIPYTTRRTKKNLTIESSKGVKGIKTTKDHGKNPTLKGSGGKTPELRKAKQGSSRHVRWLR